MSAVPWDPAVMHDVLVYHYRKNDSSCGCGWAELGHSHPKHVIEVYEASVRVLADRPAPQGGADDLAVLRDLVQGSEACCYDHHGSCQAHNLDPSPCPYERAKARLNEAGVAW